MNNRTEQFHFFATPEEAKLIRDREKEIGILNESAYLRKMAIDGYLIQMDLSDVKEAVRLLGITSSNMNQYAKKANETGRCIWPLWLISMKATVINQLGRGPN